MFQTPLAFRRWCAIAAIGGALERKVWARTNSIVYPNLYIFLVGPAAQGKGESLRHIDRLLRGLEGQFIGPTRISIQSLVDALGRATRKIMIPNGTPSFEEFNSMKLVVDELGVFINEYSRDLINNLTSLYDGSQPYVEEKRTGALKIAILKPQLNIIAGTTPDFLMSVLPENAWGEGFMSRTILIYDGEKFIKDMFPDEDLLDKLEAHYARLQRDLETIGNLYGKMEFTAEVVAAFRAWDAVGHEPVPSHPLLQSYASRRRFQMIKLCMICSASRSNELIIELEDYHRAFRFLTEAEVVMPDIFKAARPGGDARIIEEIWHFVFTNYAGGSKPISKYRLLQFIMERAPHHAVPRILQNLVESGILKPSIGPGDQIFFSPGAKPRAP